ncbi:MAG: hypothetical protein WCK21_11820, partial [Actinomycetota bacterium]
EITAVPTYVLDGRWVIPGAQDPATFVTVIRRLLAKRLAESDSLAASITLDSITLDSITADPAGDEPACEDEVCDV